MVVGPTSSRGKRRTQKKPINAYPPNHTHLANIRGFYEFVLTRTPVVGMPSICACGGLQQYIIIPNVCYSLEQLSMD